MGSDGRKKGSERARLPRRVVVISAFIIILSFIGMFLIDSSVKEIRNDYRQNINADYMNKEVVGDINRYVYKHQGLIYKYGNEYESGVDVTQVKNDIIECRNEIKRLDNALGKNVGDMPYEKIYNEFHEMLDGYFSETEKIFGISDGGDELKILKTIDGELNPAIVRIIDKVEKLDRMITDNTNKSNDVMANNLDQYRFGEIMITIAIMVISILGLVHCIFLTHDIINRDPMTHVFNIGKVGRDISRMSAKGRLNDYSCVCTNIKGLSIINQRYGTKSGDILLINYASDMSGLLRRNERMARIGGDNFLFFIKNDHLEQLIPKLMHSETEIPTAIGMKKVNIDNRCGIYPINNGDRFDDILDSAYTTLNQAKRGAEGDIVRFDKKHLEKVFRRRNILRQFKKSLKNREFIVYYQPKVECKNNAIIGAEALVRWKHDGELVPPFEFIPVLENEGSITELDFYVFDRMCKDLKEWLDAGLKPIRVSSNFSKHHLKNSDFADKIIKVIESNNVPREYIEVELTESFGYENLKAFTDFVSRMNKEGISVSLDDFGTGYSSLSVLKDINVDVVKIDKTFIDRICCGNVINEKLLINVIHMIKDLGHEIICEGVEKKEQAEFLKQQECYFIQGYLYDRPLPHDEFTERLKSPVYR